MGGDTPDTVDLLGGALCLDFANSVDWSAAGRAVKDEVLREPADLSRWGARLGLGAGAKGAVDDGEMAAALDLRSALHLVFAAVAHGELPADADLATIAAAHAQGAAAGGLAPGPAGAWGLDWPAAEPRRVRFAVAADAVALLGDGARLDRVRHCPGHDCGWLFLDTSGRRRWCSMATCGSRAKMRRLYERRRGEGAAAGA